MTDQKTPFPAEGIYMNMPEDVYHSIGGFSKTFIKAAKISPIDAWEMLYGEGKAQTPDMIYGSALHALVLEGKDAFTSRYSKAFDKADHPDALDTVDELKKYLDSRAAFFKSSESKSTLIDRVLALDPNAAILESLKAEHRLSTSGKVEIGAASFDEIVSREWVRQLSFLADMQASEISLFWIDDHFHLPCKARIDAITFRKMPFGMEARVGDVKTFTNTRDKPISDCVAYEVGSRGYHIDGVFYTRAITATPRVFHDAPDTKWPEFKDTSFELLFIEKGRALPNVLPRELVIRDNGNLTELGQAAMGAIQDAANRYRDLHESHGKQPWNQPHPLEYITEAQIPFFLL